MNRNAWMFVAQAVLAVFLVIVALTTSSDVRTKLIWGSLGLLVIALFGVWWERRRVKQGLG